MKIKKIILHPLYVCARGSCPLPRPNRFGPVPRSTRIRKFNFFIFFLITCKCLVYLNTRNENNCGKNSRFFKHFENFFDLKKISARLTGLSLDPLTFSECFLLGLGS